MTQSSEVNAYAGEWLKWMCNAGYCVEVEDIVQNAGATVGLVSGTFLKAGSIIDHGEGATIDAILIQPVTLAQLQSATPGNFMVLKRGPATVDFDKCGIATADDDLPDELATAIIQLAVLGIQPVHYGLAVWDTQTY